MITVPVAVNVRVSAYNAGKMQDLTPFCAGFFQLAPAAINQEVS
jgi:hypothetical protein